MSLLTYPLLKHFAGAVDKGYSPLRWIDLYAAQYVIEGSGTVSDAAPSTSNHIVASSQLDQLVGLAVLVSYLSSQGEIYLSLTESVLQEASKNVLNGFAFSNTASLIEILQAAPVVRVISERELSRIGVPAAESEGENCLNKALILASDRLYLARYWGMQVKFESWVYSKTKQNESLDGRLIGPLSLQLKQVFSLGASPESDQQGEFNWQAIAAAHTLLQRFSLITGGPGTGKTTTAASLLFLLMQKHQFTLGLSSVNSSGECIANEDKTARVSDAIADQLPVSLTGQTSERLRVSLLAPTGKAAVKLADSIRKHLVTIESKSMGTDVKSVRMSDCLPEAGETIHRFLYEHGALRDSLNQSKRFSSEEVLLGKKEGSQAQVDIVVIDESSMIDLALMVELIQLIPDSAQIIMLGDHFQLPPVEAGQVFSDCVKRYTRQAYSHRFAEQISLLTGYETSSLVLASVDSEQPMSEQNEQKLALESNDQLFTPLCQLKKTYRFGGDLKTAAEQIKAGEGREFTVSFSAALGDHVDAVRWFDLKAARQDLATLDNIFDLIIKPYQAYFESLDFPNVNLSELIRSFDAFQLLCSTNDGPWGVHYINDRIESQFVYQTNKHKRRASGLYHGKAILVTRNHPHLGVYNGDIGFVIANDQEHANFEIHFPSSKLPTGSTLDKGLEPSASSQSVIVVAPGRLHDWQPAYAMTIHKSQGSEYQHVGIVLADYAKELLSRPLLYTGVTRSKSKCDIWAESDALMRAFE
jgi:exodeoxyribonuclease V alpha subunit